jgi:gamma-glutamylcyclotransferase
MYYFAYASNLNRKQMAERCPDARPRFTATLPNFKLIFTGWSRKWHGGVASIKPFKGEKVIGGVYEISERDLRLLDKEEGSIYNRREVIVFPEDAEPVKAVTYIRVEQSEETKPSPEYAAAIQQGYREWGII